MNWTRLSPSRDLPAMVNSKGARQSKERKERTEITTRFTVLHKSNPEGHTKQSQLGELEEQGKSYLQ